MSLGLNGLRGQWKKTESSLNWCTRKVRTIGAQRLHGSAHGGAAPQSASDGADCREKLRKAAVSAPPAEKEQETDPFMLAHALKAETDDEYYASEEEEGKATARSSANSEQPTVTVATWKDAAEAMVATRRAQGAASSPFIGVAWHKNDRVWSAQISESSQLKNLGSFSSEEEAARSYDAAARALRGAAAHGGSGGGGSKVHALNFPTDLEQQHRQRINWNG